MNKSIIMKGALAAMLTTLSLGCGATRDDVDEVTTERAVADGTLRVVRSSDGAHAELVAPGGALLAELSWRDGDQAMTYQQPPHGSRSIALTDAWAEPDAPLDELLIHFWEQRDDLVSYGAAEICFDCEIVGGKVVCTQMKCPKVY